MKAGLIFGMAVIFFGIGIIFSERLMEWGRRLKSLIKRITKR